jgi:mono/diheme cytochrome c family protein
MRRIWVIGAVGLGLILGGHVGFAGDQDQAKSKKLNPYTGNPAAIKEGKALYTLYGCPACHNSHGGRMAPPVSDDVWVFAGDDETLFKLIKGELPDQAMPQAYAHLSDDQVWKILAFVRSEYRGDPSRIEW